MSGKIFNRWHIELFSLFFFVFFFQKIGYDMQIRDNLHEMSEAVFWKKKNKKNIISLLSAEIAQRVVKVIKQQMTI